MSYVCSCGSRSIVWWFLYHYEPFTKVIFQQNQEFNIICMQFAINAGMFTVCEQPGGSFMLKYPLIRESGLNLSVCFNIFFQVQVVVAISQVELLACAVS